MRVILVLLLRCVFLPLCAGCAPVCALVCAPLCIVSFFKKNNKELTAPPRFAIVTDLRAANVNRIAPWRLQPRRTSPPRIRRRRMRPHLCLCVSFSFCQLLVCECQRTDAACAAHHQSSSAAYHQSASASYHRRTHVAAHRSAGHHPAQRADCSVGLHCGFWRRPGDALPVCCDLYAIFPPATRACGGPRRCVIARLSARSTTRVLPGGACERGAVRCQKPHICNGWGVKKTTILIRCFPFCFSRARRRL